MDLKYLNKGHKVGLQLYQMKNPINNSAVNYMLCPSSLSRIPAAFFEGHLNIQSQIKLKPGRNEDVFYERQPPTTIWRVSLPSRTYVRTYVRTNRPLAAFQA